MRKFWAIGALLVACAGEDVGDPTDSDPGNIRANVARKLRLDGGSMAADGGSVAAEAGVIRPDAGTLADAAGALPVRDAGIPDADAGALLPDASANYPKTGTYLVTLAVITANCSTTTIESVWTFGIPPNSLIGGNVTAYNGVNGTYLTEGGGKDYAGGGTTVMVYLDGATLRGTSTQRYPYDGMTCEIVRNVNGVLDK